MKRTIITAVAQIVLGIVLAGVMLALFTLVLAMPDILEWIAGYIGGFLTYSLFFLAVGGFIVWCISERKF